MSHDFKPHHLAATTDDLAGNHGIGRYVLLPGSDGRAEAIGRRFANCHEVPSPRRHNLYLGTLEHPEAYPAQAQVFCREQLPWFSIDGDIPGVATTVTAEES